MDLALPPGWSVLPRSVVLRGRSYNVCPDKGRGYIKDDGSGNLTVVFVREDEKTLRFTISHSARILNDEEATALIQELTGATDELVKTEDGIVLPI